MIQDLHGIADFHMPLPRNVIIHQHIVGSAKGSAFNVLKRPTQRLETGNVDASITSRPPRSRFAI